MTLLLCLASTLGVAIWSAVILGNCNADLHFPSPTQSARSAQVCTIMSAEAEACVCAWGILPLHLLLPISIAGILISASLWRGIVSAAGAVTAEAASSASFPHPPLQHPLHPRKHPSLTSIPAPPSCTHVLSHIHLSGSFTLLHPSHPPSSRSGLPLHHTPSPILFIIILSPSHRSGKAGKLSLLPVKVSFSWAAGLPLSLWRMILWMKTEEMALGELLERLRTVTQSIGGWQQHIQQQLCSLVIALLIAEDCGFMDKGEISICTQQQCHSV